MRLRILKTNFDGLPPGCKWFVQTDEDGWQYLHNDGTIHGGAMPNGWYHTRQAAREAVKLYKSKQA